MSISIIVGGQWGSEGKGKVAYSFAKEKEASVAVRVGGTNSGHTVYNEEGQKYIFRILPSAALLNNVNCLLPAGSYIDLDILVTEINMAKLSLDRLMIDPNAMIITDKHKEYESDKNLQTQIGSTLSGTGAAVIERINRYKLETPRLAKDILELKTFLGDTKQYLRSELKQNHHIIIEGTQGYGLSVLHSNDYPYATSRDTTAAGFLAETGLSPFDVENIVMVIRAFPIRVAGDSGPLPDETDWQTVTLNSKSSGEIIEYTSATNRVRRVSQFDAGIVRQAITANKPNLIVLNHLDYLDSSVKNRNTLTEPVIDFVQKVEASIEQRIDYLGNGEMVLLQR